MIEILFQYWWLCSVVKYGRLRNKWKKVFFSLEKIVRSSLFTQTNIQSLLIVDEVIFTLNKCAANYKIYWVAKKRFWNIDFFREKIINFVCKQFLKNPLVKDENLIMKWRWEKNYVKFFNSDCVVFSTCDL